MSDVNHMESPVVGRETVEDQPVSPCQVECACSAFLKAHAALVEITSEPTGSSGNTCDPDPAAVALIRERRDAALQTVKSSQATNFAAVSAKMKVVIVLAEWCGVQDVMIGPLAIQVIQEAMQLVGPNTTLSFRPPVNGRALSHSRFPWIDRLQRFTWHASEQRTTR